MSASGGWTFPRVGDRVRFTESCPWPERVGCQGIVVAPPTDGTYPQPAKWEVLVLIDEGDDPLSTGAERLSYRPGYPAWSCVISAKSCDVIP